MPFSFPMTFACLAACAFPLVVTGPPDLRAQAPASTTGTPSALPAADSAAAHTPPVTAKINALAHKVLAAGLRLNGLEAASLQPWHMRVDFQIVAVAPKPIAGSMEEWWMGSYRSKRVYSSSRADWNGIEWSMSHTDRFRSKPVAARLDADFLNLRVGRPVIDPLYQAANIKPEHSLSVRRITSEGVALNCVAKVSSDEDGTDTNADFLFPTMCFDNDMHLRLTVAGDTSVQFDDVQIFQGRAVARDVKIILKGALIAEMKVSLLESISANADLVKPAANALPLPFHIEPGMPKPEPIYEVGASIPIPPGGLPYRGTASMPILIRKDGTVKPNPDGVVPMPWLHDLSESIEVALAKWKYKPCMVDGQPVEVALTVSYPIDGKPFVPSYERPKPKPVVTAPDDFSSAYDPKRDPAKDLTMAETQAAQGKKRILVDVGGDWCSWCKTLDKLFDDHQDLKTLRDQNFVLMKVNMSANNENYAFLSQYPAIPGYPWIFVLDADGKLLKSEDTNGLEDNANGYNAKAIKTFLETWQAK